MKSPRSTTLLSSRRPRLLQNLVLLISTLVSQITIIDSRLASQGNSVHSLRLRKHSTGDDSIFDDMNTEEMEFYKHYILEKESVYELMK